MLRRTRRVIAWFLGTVVIALVCGAVVPAPGRLDAMYPTGNTASGNRISVLVLDNGIYTDIALPATPDVMSMLSDFRHSGLRLNWSAVEWIVIGRVGRRFYLETPTWGDLRPGPVTAAFTWDRAVMHVQPIGPVGPSDPGVLTIALSTDAFARLVSGITESFHRASNSEIVLIPGVGYSVSDAFFEAHGGFNAVVGCNIWTARMLRRAGLQTGFWTPLSWATLWSLRFHNPQLSATSNSRFS